MVKMQLGFDSINYLLEPLIIREHEPMHPVEVESFTFKTGRIAQHAMKRIGRGIYRKAKGVTII